MHKESLILSMRIYLIAIVLFLFGTGHSLYAQPHTLTVEIEQVVPGRGVLKISLYDAPGSFLEQGLEKHQSDLEEGGSTRFVFDQIPPGEYAIAVIQDSNKNGTLDKGMFGPTEPYGFSNDAGCLFGPPSFEDASFELTGNREMTIELK